MTGRVCYHGNVPCGTKTTSHIFLTQVFDYIILYTAFEKEEEEEKDKRKMDERQKAICNGLVIYAYSLWTEQTCSVLGLRGENLGTTSSNLQV